MDDQAAPTAQALRLIASRYPQALGAILGGSAAQGRATPTSDLDVAILLPDSDTGRREVIRHDGRLAELFLHTLAELPDSSNGTERAAGAPFSSSMTRDCR